MTACPTPACFATGRLQRTDRSAALLGRAPPAQKTRPAEAGLEMTLQMSPADMPRGEKAGRPGLRPPWRVRQNIEKPTSLSANVGFPKCPWREKRVGAVF